MIDVPLFGEPMPKPEFPPRVYRMHAIHGHGPEGRTCKGCSHLIHQGHHDYVYIKCELYGNTMGSGTDWRQKWPACGAFAEAAG
jgi:hypothetical protein